MSFAQSIELLRALAEPTRYRLLALLKDGELTVGEIAEALAQSQPRISRHLKLLSEVAALERFREEQRIYYRLASNGEVGPLLHTLLSQLQPDDHTLQHDQQQRAVVLDKRARHAAAQWEDVRRSAESTYSNAQLVNAVRKAVLQTTPASEAQSLGELLDVGTGSGSMLRVLGGHATHAVGLDMSTQALRIARAKVHGAGLKHCVFKRGDMYALPFAANSFDTVSFDQVLSVAARPAVALREAVRVLRRGGRVIVVEDNRRIDQTATKPQVIMQQWLEQAGVRCDKLKALHVGNTKLLLGLGQRS